MPEPARCPVCGQQAAKRVPGKRSPFPFCSDRCRQVDLARWFDGRYAIPAQEEEPRDPGEDDTPGGQG